MRLTATHKMGIAALIMAGSVFLSRLMGLVRDKVVSWQFGAGAESDVYFAAFVVPDFLNYLLAGGYISITLIPLLSKRFEEDEADGWRFFSAVFCTMVSPILCCAPSMVRTQGSPSSSTFFARNEIVSKLASVSAEQPTKAA